MTKNVRKQIREQVKSQIATIFSEEDISAQKKVLEELLEESAEAMLSLTEKLADKEIEIAGHLAAVDEANSKVSSVESEFAEFKKQSEGSSVEIQVLTKERDDLKEELATLNRTLTLESRVKELEAAGILRAGDALEKQRSYVASMDDESFTNYKDHLVETKKELEETIKAAALAAAEGRAAASVDGPTSRELAAVSSTATLAPGTVSKFASFFDKE